MSLRGIHVHPGLVIPESELEVRRTRSGGPGGQNVNKVSTRVELHFDVVNSQVLSAEQKDRIRRRLASRVSRAGVLRVVSQAHRSQARNESAARVRLAELLAAALHKPATRRPTRPSRQSKARRLEEKRRRSQLKTERRKPTSSDG